MHLSDVHISFIHKPIGHTHKKWHNKNEENVLLLIESTAKTSSSNFVIASNRMQEARNCHAYDRMDKITVSVVIVSVGRVCFCSSKSEMPNMK